MHSDTFADEVERQFLQGRRPPSSSSPLKKGDPFSTPLKKRTSSSPNPVLGLPLTKNLPSPPQSSPPSSSSLPFRRSTHSLGTVHQGVLAVQQHAFGKDSGWKRTVPPRERLDEAHTKAINFVSWQSAGLRALQTLSKNKKLDPVLLKNATLNHPLPLNTTTTTTTTHSHPTPPSQGGKGEETSEGGNVTSSLLPFTSKHPSQEEHPSLLGKDVEITSFPSLYTVTFEKLFEFL
ncbi:hypothetical protein HMI55_002463 [Coelomomyces lativittatus]|nr:hypothetical protein HMI56_005156 [Coelomomyces lativittatus]KAJ1503423.1 hypothetical protein HMI55_002463 [Coelomomyces lativittatus]